MSRAIFLATPQFSGVKNAGEANGGMQESRVPEQSSGPPL
jgi:hypothetical protein